MVVLSQIQMQNKTYAMIPMLPEYYLNVNTYQKTEIWENREELSNCNIINYTVHDKII